MSLSLQQMRELIAEHKPHIDKMNKTGPQLLELSPEEGVPIREKYTATDQLYTKLKADVKQRAATLDEAISKSTQVWSSCSQSVFFFSAFFLLLYITFMLKGRNGCLFCPSLITF